MFSKFLLFLPFLTLCQAGRILVLVDNLITRETHSIFFKNLADRGHVLTFKPADDPTLALFKYREDLLYDHLILFCPTVEVFGGSLDVQEITKFIDNGGNVLIGANSNVGEAIRELANEVNFEFDDEKSFVIDHMTYDQLGDDGKHTSVLVDPAHLVKAPYIVGDKKYDKPILFRGVGLVTEKDTPLTIEILKGSYSTYCFNPNKATIDQYPHAIGESAILIGAMQARNNARVVLTGSLDMFSDEFILATVQASNGKQGDKTANEQLANALSEWVFNEKGVIRVKSVGHHLVNEKIVPAAYTITDMVEYGIEIEEFKNGKWQPFVADDVQMEFVRIDPFVRSTLKHKNGKYSVQFKVPDAYGVYKFVVDYNRVGLTYLYSVTQVSVRPFEHTQFERFIRSAFPYYASAFSMMFALFLFSCFFLHFKDSPVTAGKN